MSRDPSTKLSEDIVSSRENGDYDDLRDIAASLSDLLQLAALAKNIELVVAVGDISKERKMLRVLLYLIAEQFAKIASDDLSEQIADIKAHLRPGHRP
jgi:hypothetical protein